LLDFHELKFGLKTLGFDLPKPRVYDLLTKNGVPPPWHNANEQCSGPSLRITAAAFESIASALIASRDPREELSRAFDMFDQDGDGLITLEDLRVVNSTIKQGTSATDKDMANMIAQADLTGKGGVDREEFIDMMMAAKRRRGY
jgi:centrin-3